MGDSEGLIMFVFRILNANPVDVVAVMLCLITIWWCVRYVPTGPRPTRFVLAVLGVLTAWRGTRMLDAMISVAFLVAAIMLEISPRHAGRDNDAILSGPWKKGTC
jgi:intracellular septation protein A